MAGISTRYGTFDFDKGPDFSRADQLARQAAEENQRYQAREAALKAQIAEQDVRTQQAYSFLSTSSGLAQASVPRARAMVLAPIQQNVMVEAERSSAVRVQAQSELEAQAARVNALQGASIAERDKAASNYNRAVLDFNYSQGLAVNQSRERLIADVGVGSFKKISVLNKEPYKPAVLAPGFSGYLVSSGTATYVEPTWVAAKEREVKLAQSVRAQNIKALALAAPMPSKEFVRGLPERETVRTTGFSRAIPSGYTADEAKEFLFRPTATSIPGRVTEFFGEEIGRPVVESTRQLEDFYGRGIFNRGGRFTRVIGTGLGIVSAPFVVGQNLITKETYALEQATGGLPSRLFNVSRYMTMPYAAFALPPVSSKEFARGVGIVGGFIGGASVSAGPEKYIRAVAAKQLQPVVIAQTRVPAVDFGGFGRVGQYEGVVSVRQPTFLSKLVYGNIPSKSVGVGPFKLPVPTKLALNERTILRPFTAMEKTIGIGGEALTKPAGTIPGRSLVEIRIETGGAPIKAVGEVGFGQQTIDKVKFLEPSRLGSNFVTIAENRVFGEFRGTVDNVKKTIPFKGTQQVTTEVQGLWGLRGPAGPIETRVTDLGGSVSKVKSYISRPLGLPGPNYTPEVQSLIKKGAILSESEIKAALKLGEELRASEIKAALKAGAELEKVGFKNIIKLGERGSIGGGAITRGETQTVQLLKQVQRGIPIRAETAFGGIQSVASKAIQMNLARVPASAAYLAGGIAIQIQKLPSIAISAQLQSSQLTVPITGSIVTTAKKMSMVQIPKTKLIQMSMVKTSEIVSPITTQIAKIQTIAMPVTSPITAVSVPVLPPTPPITVPPISPPPIFGFSFGPMLGSTGTYIRKPQALIESESATGYEVHVKTNRGFIVANKPNTSLREQDALRFGEAVTDNTVAKSFILVRSKKPVTGLSRPLPNVAYKFSLPKGRRFPMGTYTEKRQYGIDTPGEKRGLSVARALAEYRKVQTGALGKYKSIGKYRRKR